MFGLLVSRKLRVLTICQNRPFRVTGELWQKFFKNPKTSQTRWRLPLAIVFGRLSADERLESGK